MKVMIIGGFLGSGKTTTLLNLGKHMSGLGHRIAIIVNEIGEIGVDGDTISSSGVVTKELTSGCICCTLKYDMKYTLKKLQEDFKPDVVIIEPTGIAFPKQIRDELAQMDLPDTSFAPVVHLVDASRFNTEVQQIPVFITTQIKDADVLCINKIDITGAEQIASVNDFLRELNPDAEILQFSARASDEQFQRFIDLLAEEGETDLETEERNSIEMSGVSTYSAEFMILSDLDANRGTSISKSILENVKIHVREINPDFIGHIKISLKLPDVMIKASLTAFDGSPHIELFEQKENTQTSLKMMAAVTNIPTDKLLGIVETVVREKLAEEELDFKKPEPPVRTINIIK